MNPEQWLSLKWNGGSTMSDRWLNQSKIIHALQVNLVRLRKTLARFGLEQRIETVRGQGYRMKG